MTIEFIRENLYIARAMADPLSVCASVAGLITIADLVFQRTFKYVKGVRAAPKTIARLSSEIGGLHGILHSVHLLLSQLEQEPFISAIGPFHIASCEQTLQKIKTILDKHETTSDHVNKMQALKNSLKWPFSVAETEELIAEIERHKSTLSLALTADGMSGLLEMLSRQNQLRDGIGDIKRDLQQRHEAETRISINKENQDMLDAIGHIDPYNSHQINLNFCHPGTGHWFIDGQSFKQWLNASSSRLWMNGIPGAGKTVLCASAIQAALEMSSPDLAVAFFYCDYKDSATQDPSNILGSLATQIAKQNKHSLNKLQEFYRKNKFDNRRSPLYEPKELRNLILKMATEFSSSLIIVDGLDECGPNTTVVVEVLASLNADSEESNIRTLFSSRDEMEIKEVLENYHKVAIAAESSDLRLYVGAEIHNRIRDRKLRIKDQSLKEYILERLVQDADGMYVSPLPLSFYNIHLDFFCWVFAYEIDLSVSYRLLLYSGRQTCLANFGP